MREHNSPSCAWLGQHPIGAGSRGGATRLDGCSMSRQSPRGSHGCERQFSCGAGTQTFKESKENKKKRYKFVIFVNKHFL